MVTCTHERTTWSEGNEWETCNACGIILRRPISEPIMKTTITEKWIPGRDKYSMVQVWTITAPEPYGTIQCGTEEQANAWASLLNDRTDDR